MYSPYLGRFVSPDPLLNSEGGPLLYNPYVYANNNPFKYIDRNGEFIIFPILSFLQYFHGNDAAVKACGVVATALSIGVGVYVGSVVTAGVGAIGVSVGSPVIAGAAPFVGAAAGAAASYLTYNLSYSALTGTPVNFSWKDMGIEMGIAVATVGVCTVASKLASKSSKIMQTRHRPTATNPDEMAAMAESKAGPKYLKHGEEVQKGDWPPSDRVPGTTSLETLEPGTRVDRYCNSMPGQYDTAFDRLHGGEYFSKPGVSVDMRAIPYDPKTAPYAQWELLRPLDVERSIAAPFPKFGLPGGGVQYRFIHPETGGFMTPQYMLDNGYIKIITVHF